MQFTNNINVLVTGAGCAAGQAVVLAFARSGCQNITMADRSLESLKARQGDIMAQDCSLRLHLQAFDGSAEEDVEGFFTKLMTHLPRIDIAVNLVSQTEDGVEPTGLSIEQYDRNFSIYQRGTFLIERALLRQMLTQDISDESGCRGIITNVIDYGPTPSLADYPVRAAIANAIIGFSKTDACDYAQDNIRINCVAAGEVLTEKVKPELPGGVPLPRVGKAEDIAHTVLSLSHKGASWLTGLVIPVDGGRSLNHFW